MSEPMDMREALEEGFKWEKTASKEDVASLYADHKAALSAIRDLRFANTVNSDEWRQRVESLEVANKEKDAEIERLKAATQLHNDSAVEAWRLTHKWVKRVFDLKSELSSLRASLGGERAEDAWKRGFHEGVLAARDEVNDEDDPSLTTFVDCIRSNIGALNDFMPTYVAPPTLPTEKE